MSEHKIILSPRSKERALYMLEQNKVEFYVARTASKYDIKGAVQALFQVVVSKVNTRISKILVMLLNLKNNQIYSSSSSLTPKAISAK